MYVKTVTCRAYPAKFMRDKAIFTVSTTFRCHSANGGHAMILLVLVWRRWKSLCWLALRRCTRWVKATRQRSRLSLKLVISTRLSKFSRRRDTSPCRWCYNTVHQRQHLCLIDWSVLNTQHKTCVYIHENTYWGQWLYINYYYISLSYIRRWHQSPILTLVWKKTLCTLSSGLVKMCRLYT